MRTLTDIVRSLPLTPGCYLFKDLDGQVLYVGKSKCLRKRVSSYFGRHKDDKFVVMMRFVADISHQCTDTDIEALLLEHKLIKTYRPLYNARMRKDPGRWYIKIDNYKPYTGLFVVSEPARQETPYTCVGPFTRQDHAILALDLIGSYWRMPTCGFGDGKHKSVCLRYHIQQCRGPCTGCASVDEYEFAIQEIMAFFRGDSESVLFKIKNMIFDASESMAYEKAAHLRDLYENLRTLASQIERMPPELNGEVYYVLLKSRHEESFLLAYLQNSCVIAWMRFASIDEWDAKSNVMLRYVKTGKILKQHILSKDFIIFEQSEGLRLVNAILEVDALRHFSTDIINSPCFPYQW